MGLHSSRPFHSLHSEYTTVKKEEAKVCLYEEGLATVLDEFCRKAWPQTPQPVSPHDLSMAEVRGVGTPRPPTFLFLKGEKAVGHVSTIPVQLWAGGEMRPAHWLVGFMVLPEFRNGLVGPLLIKEANRRLDIALSLHVESTVLRIMTGLKWVHKGVIPQYLRILNAIAVMQNLQLSGVDAISSTRGGVIGIVRSWMQHPLARRAAGWGLAMAQSLWVALMCLFRPGLMPHEVVEEEQFDESYTELWQGVSSHVQAALVRDQAYLKARYGSKMKRYRLLACRNGKQLLGYCIIKMKAFEGDARMGNMKIGTIVDGLYDPNMPSTWQALLNAALLRFKQERTDVVLCTASLLSLRKVLVANGFVSIPGNLNFTYHSRTATPLDQISLESWHLMRGDSDADQNF